MKKSRSVLALVLCLCMFFGYIAFGFMQNRVYAVESLESKKNAILTSAIQYIKSSQNEDGSFDYNQLWNNHLKGLLFEYLRGMPDSEGKLKTLENAFFGKQS